MVVVGGVSRGVVAGRNASRAEARRRGAPAPARQPVLDVCTGDCEARALPRSIRRAAGLETFADPEIALAAPARAAAAARAFSAGNGYLSGLIVDRLL